MAEYKSAQPTRQPAAAPKKASLASLNPNSGSTVTRVKVLDSRPISLLPNVTNARLYTMCSRREVPANTPEMRQWDGKLNRAPLEEYLEKARGGLDAVRGDQWGYQAAQQLPEAALNEVGGLLAGKLIGKLGNYGRGGVVIVTKKYSANFRSQHILNRHKYGSGKSGKTEFPKSWSDSKILREVESVASDPNSKTFMGKWNSPYRIGVRDGVEIRVDFYPNGHPQYGGQISTGYPINTPANP